VHAFLNRHLPPLGAEKNVGIATVIGILTGGIGLAVYFRSLRDVVPVDLTVGLVMVALAFGANPFEVGAVAGSVIGGLYGYWRAQSSNRRRAEPGNEPA
jgi:hypothetical protein